MAGGFDDFPDRRGRGLGLLNVGPVACVFQPDHVRAGRKLQQALHHVPPRVGVARAVDDAQRNAAAQQGPHQAVPQGPPGCPEPADRVGHALSLAVLQQRPEIIDQCFGGGPARSEQLPNRADKRAARNVRRDPAAQGRCEQALDGPGAIGLRTHRAVEQHQRADGCCAAVRLLASRVIEQARFVLAVTDDGVVSKEEAEKAVATAQRLFDAWAAGEGKGVTRPIVNELRDAVGEATQ